jgi:SAM-dependent methyltransferase
MRGTSAGYALAYRLGITPWERYGRAAESSIGALLDREADERSGPGRAIDLGCGRGQKARQLVERGWDTVGVDNVPGAIEAANRAGIAGATFRVADVTELAGAYLGAFDFFLDVGCFKGLDSTQRFAAGRAVSALAAPGATLLMLAFQPTRLGFVVGGVSQADVESAFPDWEMLSVEPADTEGLGWPLSRTSPRWYRLGLRRSR